MCLTLPLQAESRNAELSLLLNKLQSEDAALRDSLAKVGSMNEGLAQDKVDLNTYILQVCMYTNGLFCHVNFFYHLWLDLQKVTKAVKGLNLGKLQQKSSGSD